MCRRNLVFAAALVAFGGGLMLSIVFDSVLIRLCISAAAILLGIGLLRGNC